MGSTGSGSFTDYSNPQKQENGIGGSSGTDNCGKAFSTKLEEIERCDYYRTKSNVPTPGTEIEIYFNGRIVARTLDGIDLGLLPTKYNYIKVCIEDGFIYRGIISFSSTSPLPSITIDITPNK